MVTTSGRTGQLLRLSGEWTSRHARELEQLVAGAAPGLAGAAIKLDIAAISRLDTVGALLLDRLQREIAASGGTSSIEGGRPEQRILLEAISRNDHPPAPQTKRENNFYTLIADIGSGMVSSVRDLQSWVAFLGAVMATTGSVLLRPTRFRFTSFVNHLDLVGLRAVPIVMLIAFLVGAIIAQQSIFQLRYFGASVFVVDLVGILSMRELGVLLAAIMLAGRSGSAFTAEIGSMKMREEIDAIRVMALDSIEVLILPRIFALIVGLTLLTFLAMIASMAGGALVAVVYGGISLETFLARLPTTLTIESFLVGMLKAPFMGLVVGLIASIEGMKVEGSAESLGSRTTASVVKSIFMVIVLDGLFAIFFAAIGF
ncbi:ABC transporter permease [Terrihabitans sp. B22-R8]|uniref:ABC transporter permease n=1 Tax=Terrihabitans sp. B22-R8 TaxID=3425128 RepID=UPI00403C4706